MQYQGINGDIKSDSGKKKFVVFAATGDQGKSVCKYLMEDGRWEVYGISRNPENYGSKELKKMGVKVVKGDMGDPTSYAEYLRGAYGAFVNADFWGPYFSSGMNSKIGAETETKHSKDAVDECIKAGLKHVVYSTLDDLGENGIPHFDSKVNVAKYIKTTSLPTTFLYTSAYFSNITKFGQITKDKKGRLLLSTPTPDDCLIPSFAVEQTGKWVVKALNDPERFIDQDIQACSEIITVSKMASILSDVAETKFETLEMTREEFDSNGNDAKVDHELWLNMDVFVKHMVERDVGKSKELVPDQWSFKDWAEQDHDFKKIAGI